VARPYNLPAVRALRGRITAGVVKFGKHARFRSWCRKAWGFESLRPHVEISRETLLVVLAVAALAPLLADLPAHVRVPVIVTEIIAGIVVGPQVLDLAQPDAVLDTLSDFGLAFLFFMAGMEIDPANMRGRPATLAARGWLASLTLGMGVAFVLWTTGAVGAPVLVGLALTTTALGALVPILKDAKLAEHRVGRLVLAGGAAGEFGPIVALSIILAIASGEPWRTVLLVVFAVIAVGAGLLATRARPERIVRLVAATMHSSGQFALRLALLLLGGLVVLAGSLGLDVVLGAFAAGFIVGLVARGEDARAFHVKLDAVGYGFLIPIFFISTGLGFDLDALGNATTLLLVPAFAALFLLVRGVPAWLLARSELPERERTALAFLTASALPLVVAITEVATENGELAQDDASALVGAAMLSLLAFPLVGTALLRR
jgi:Kef-type K+ transport system membrane component KefB